MRYKLVVVIGNVASGKSSLARKLAKRLSGVWVPADELYKVNPFFPLALEDRKRWSLASDLWFLKERVKLAREAEEKLGQGHVVVDSGLPMSWVYAHSRIRSGYFTQEEWALYQEMYEVVTRGVMAADVGVYLKADVPYLRQRIEKRGREFEILKHSEEYLQSIESSLEAYLRKQTPERQVVVHGRIDFNRVLEQVRERL